MNRLEGETGRGDWKGRLEGEAGRAKKEQQVVESNVAKGEWGGVLSSFFWFSLYPVLD